MKKEIQNQKLTFLERIAFFDFEKYYTPGIRFLCHLSMWLLFTCLLQANLFIDSSLKFENSIAFAGRSLICNMTVFYVFFYVAVPNTVLKNRIGLAIVCFPLCFVLWVILNHYCLLFIGKHFKIESPYYKQGVESNLHASLWYLLSPKNLLVSITPVFYSISPYFFTKIVFDIVRSNSRVVNLEKKKSQLEIEKLNLEKNFLTAQLNPHFLFNTLNNLYGHALCADDQTPDMILKLADMMRYTLYESRSEKVSIKKELEYLGNYVILEKNRYQTNKQIILNVDDSQIDDQLIAPLLTFPFVENAFKYGLKSKKEERFLKIDISVKGGIFYFTCINDKSNNIQSSEFGGIGHSNVKKRLELLYPGKHELTIEDRGNTFFVTMTINLR
jgi:hypothetical protein